MSKKKATETALVFAEHGDIFTTSLIIANETDNDHRSVKRLLKKFRSEFEEFGTFAISNRESTGGRPDEIYYLNELQATYLMTLLKNTENVRNFKIRLVKQFYALKNELLRIKANKLDPEWQTARLETKIYTQDTNDVIKELTTYAIEQGSTNPDQLYQVYQKLIKLILGYSERDAMSTPELIRLAAYEAILRGIISDGMQQGLHYKVIYRNASPYWYFVSKLTR